MAASGDADGDAERVNASRVGSDVLFRHFFEGGVVFDRLKPYYEPPEYRFSVPVARLSGVQACSSRATATTCVWSTTGPVRGPLSEVPPLPPPVASFVARARI